MPKPQPNEKEQEFIRRCIPQVVKDGTVEPGNDAQAFAVCQGIWNQDKGIKNPELENMLDKKQKNSKIKDSMDIDKMKSLETVDLKPAHILSAGTWEAQTGRVTVTEKDLEEMVENFSSGVIDPVLNLDHSDQMTEKVKNFLSVAALGYVKELKKEGKKLFASFKQVPVKIAELINSGAIKQRSPEFFRTLKRGGQIYHNVLKAVSFFGRELPAGMLDDYVEVFKMSMSENDFDGEVLELKKQMEDINMSDVTIPKSQYDELVTAKAASDVFEIKLQSSEAQIEKLQSELTDMTKEVEEAKQLKAAVETEKAEMLKKEAVAYIDGAIESGKLLPKYKDSYVDDYMLKAADESKLKIFMEDIDNRTKVVELSNIKDTPKPNDSKDDPAVSELKSDTNAMMGQIEKLQAEKGITFNEAALELGLNVQSGGDK
jgi:hypothetical protein